MTDKQHQVELAVHRGQLDNVFGCPIRMDDYCLRLQLASSRVVENSVGVASGGSRDGGIVNRRALLLAGGLAGTCALLAAACHPTNPGTFTFTADSTQSHMSIDNSGGNIAYAAFVAPACSDGADNDADGNTDYPADSNCASATDNNERLAGNQTAPAVQIPFHISSGDNFHISVEPSETTVPVVEFCTNSTTCLNAGISGSANTNNATYDSGTGYYHVPYTYTLTLTASVGLSDLPSGCQIGPMNADLTVKSMNSSTGWTDAIMDHTAIPTVTTCGSYNTTLNNGLGTSPTMTLTLKGYSLNSSGQAPQFSS